MATRPTTPAQLQPFKLVGSGAAIGDTTITLQSMLDINGASVTMSYFGTKGYGTLEPGNGTSEEQISFTGVTQNANGTATLTGVSRVLFISPFTETSGIAKTHAGASTFIISNTAGFENAIYNYVDSVVSGSAGNASSTVAGLTKLSIDPAVAGNPIAVGANNTLSGTAISSSNKVVDAGSLATTSTANAVVQANGSGVIDGSFLSASKIDKFTSNGTWTKPTGAKSVFVTLIGAGGGGGGANGSAGGGGGGGGGAITKSSIDASLLTSTVSVTVGIFGAGGLAASSGSDGGDSSFGSYLVAKGGKGGGAPQGAGGISGIGYPASSNSTNGGIGYLGTGGGGSQAGGSYNGGNGGNGTDFVAGGGGGGGASSGGSGGSANMGTPAANMPIIGSGGSGATGSGNGNNGSSYGGGGGGAIGGTNTGGNGASGFVQVITYF